MQRPFFSDREENRIIALITLHAPLPFEQNVSNGYLRTNSNDYSIESEGTFETSRDAGHASFDLK